jgi:hypothetical protein
MTPEQPQTFRPYVEAELPFREIVESFEETLRDAAARLSGYDDDEAALRPAPGKWSRKEILGHLIDSACNNHGRFVRVQLEDGLSLPGYSQNEWVAAGGYQERAWNDLVSLWEGYNRQLLHLISHIPEQALANRCSINGSEPLSLRFVIADYVAHLQHHLRQIFR